jgi:hypothetical protein
MFFDALRRFVRDERVLEVTSNVEVVVDVVDETTVIRSKSSEKICVGSDEDSTGGSGGNVFDLDFNRLIVDFFDGATDCTFFN